MVSCGLKASWKKLMERCNLLCLVRRSENAEFIKTGDGI
jgi:hypothetical protein